MTFESRFLAKFRSVEDFPDPLPLQKKTANVSYNYDNDSNNNINKNQNKNDDINGNNNNNSNNNNNNSSSPKTVKSDRNEKKVDSKNGVVKRRKSFTEKLFKNASGGTLRLTSINASKLKDIFFGDKFANKESSSDDVFCNGLEVASEEIYSSPCSLPPNIGCLPEYENVDYFIPVSSSSSVISLPKHNGLKSPNAGRLRTFRRTDSPYGTILKEKLNRSRLQLSESTYSDVDTLHSASPFSYTVPLCSALNSSISSVTPPVITNKKESTSSPYNISSTKSPLFKVENSLRETFNYVKSKDKKVERKRSFTYDLSTEPKSSFYDTVASADSFSSFSSESSTENEITDLENKVPSSDIYNHLQTELKLKFCELKRKSDSSLPKISVSHCNGHDNEEPKNHLTNIKPIDEMKNEEDSNISKHSSDTQHTSQPLRSVGKFEATYSSIINGNASKISNGSPNQSQIFPYNSRNLGLNLSNGTPNVLKKEYFMQNTYPKPEVNRMQNAYSKPEVNGMQKYYSTETLSKSNGSVHESNGVTPCNSTKTLNDFHKELMQKCTTLKSKTSNLSRNEYKESEQPKIGIKFSIEDKFVSDKPSISQKPRLTRKPDIYSCPLNTKISEENGINESEIRRVNNRPDKPIKPPFLLEIDQLKSKHQKIEINNNSIVVSEHPSKKSEIYFSLQKKDKLDFRHLSNSNLRQNSKKINIYSNIEENMSSHISLTNLSNLQKSDSYNTLKVKDLVATFNKCTVPSGGTLTKDINRPYLPNETTRFPPKKCLSEYNLTNVKRRSSYK